MLQLVQKREKLNPVQPLIAQEEGGQLSSLEPRIKYYQAYEKIEVVQRGINMIIDDLIQVPIHVDSEKLAQKVPVNTSAMKAQGVSRLLNSEPNPYMSTTQFWTEIVKDLLLDGNAFIYFDGEFIYHLPAKNVTVISDPITFVAGYRYSARSKPFKPEEIIHIKEVSGRHIYRGRSRLYSSVRAINTLRSMRDFQDNFFKNGAVPGLILKTKDVLSERIKERAIRSWQARYNPSSGGRRPLILDGGMDVDSLTNVNFKELDFESSIENLEYTILKALGIPPILLDSGNNANIRPNHRLYYLETIIPLLRRIIREVERFFGFVMWEDVTDIPALQPELREQAAYLSGLVNGGIIVVDEARSDLGKPALTSGQGEGNKIRIPANIAGSAGNPTDGGRPPNDEDE